MRKLVIAALLLAACSIPAQAAHKFSKKPVHPGVHTARQPAPKAKPAADDDDDAPPPPPPPRIALPYDTFRA